MTQPCQHVWARRCRRRRRLGLACAVLECAHDRAPPQAPAPTLLDQGRGADELPAPLAATNGRAGSTWTRARVQYAVTRNLVLRGGGDGAARRPPAPAGALGDPAGDTPAGGGKRARAPDGPDDPNPRPSRQPALHAAAGGAPQRSDGVVEQGRGGGRLGLRAVQRLVAAGLPLEAGDSAGARGAATSLPALAAHVQALRCAADAADALVPRRSHPGGALMCARSRGRPWERARLAPWLAGSVRRACLAERGRPAASRRLGGAGGADAWLLGALALLDAAGGAAEAAALAAALAGAALRLPPGAPEARCAPPGPHAQHPLSSCLGAAS